MSRTDMFSGHQLSPSGVHTAVWSSIVYKCLLVEPLEYRDGSYDGQFNVTRYIICAYHQNKV